MSIDNPPDITQVTGQINGLLDESITGHAIRGEGPAPLDLSKINFGYVQETPKGAMRHQS